ncbi:hypothetical protein [Rhizobium sp. G21]|uniref:hypothetical protein n=1 Tax=Rhizobium sp. G21 TaxID=2758439 RepID=UPI0015FFA175|nr:hypothetical protein [Rhizobium sp. G21]MBB1247478.1 hypothetical protein [Rhizobium sp. G21]
MVISHSYLASQLRPFLEIAGQMDDVFPAYALSMLIEHCDDVAMKKPIRCGQGRDLRPMC